MHFVLLPLIASLGTYVLFSLIGGRPDILASGVLLILIGFGLWWRRRHRGGE